jgi:hypothetical protein
MKIKRDVTVDMSRRHFQFIAMILVDVKEKVFNREFHDGMTQKEIVRKYNDGEFMEEIQDLFVDRLKETNHNFKESTFRDWVGWKGESPWT